MKSRKRSTALGFQIKASAADYFGTAARYRKVFAKADTLCNSLQRWIQRIQDAHNIALCT